MVNKKIITTTLLCAGILTGCSQNSGSFIPSTDIFTKKIVPSAYDGRWIGSYTLIKGDPSCPRRGVMNVQVEGGVLYAKTIMNRYVSRWQGEIKGDTVTGETERKDAVSGTGTFTGQMSETYAQGHWKSKICYGTWDATKAQ